MSTSREVVVRGAAAAFKQDVEIGPHHLTADEPADAGGGESGPTPYDLLLSALGTCTSMTLGLYARRKGWPLSNVTVRLRHDRIHAEDCEHCESPSGLIDRLERAIELEGPLSDEQRARLLAIADHCPVHKTLKSEIDIRTTLTPR